MQRRQLVGVFKLLSLVGGALLLLPMLLSTGVFSNSTPAQGGLLVDIRNLQAGQKRAIEYAGREYWIYRWSLQDRQRQGVEDERQAWSVLIPYEPHRGCQVHLQEDMGKTARFVEPCFNASFDVRGWRLPGTGIAAQRNLPAIPFQWQNDNELRLQLGTSTGQ